MFKNIKEHWNHFLERDIAPEAPPIQVLEMKRAFLAGAASGIQLAYADRDNKDAIRKHIDEIKALAGLQKI